MDRFICIHGHFYQPPRENPWLEVIEVQDSAYPFHDWNQRVNAECYAPNSAARILDREGLVEEIINNYSRISFNFGPTLLSWMETEAPSIYEAVLQADRQSIERFSGHGAAIAQAYNHMIMPLANERDLRTQVIWGIEDFERRFQRSPEGMWLPETAANTATLEALAEQGINFTILAPRQAARVRKIGEQAWHDVWGERVDPRRPYLCRLPSGREIVLFFYEGGISQDVAFNHLLTDGRIFADRLRSAFDTRSAEPELIHIATDGETYGHHHRFGDMALARAIKDMEADSSVQITVYGEYLEKHPPEWEAQIVENSSWSCVHGVERWRSDCGCNTGRNRSWRQHWRAPLRDALDWLRDSATPLFDKEAALLFKDPWAARDAYISVVLDRSEEQITSFMTAQLAEQADEPTREKALKLLELQRHLMLTYTSCGWFFDELSGIETVQVIEYAGRALQLANELFGPELERGFLERLEKAPSNLPEHGNGREIYEKWVQPATIGLKGVAAHYAISSLFDRDTGGTNAPHAYEVELEDWTTSQIGRVRLATGIVNVTSRITTESGRFDAAVLHLGDHNVSCGVLPFESEERHETLFDAFETPAQTGDLQGLIHAMDETFGESQFSLRYLFRDEQRRILEQILQSATEGAEGVYQALYEQQLPVMRFLSGLNSPIPQAFISAAEYFLNAILRRELDRTDRPLDASWVRARLNEAQLLGIKLDQRGLGFLLEREVHEMLDAFRDRKTTTDDLARLEVAVDLAKNSPLSVDLWDAQTTVYQMSRGEYMQAVREAAEGNEDSRRWASLFESLARNVSVKLPVYEGAHQPADAR